MNYYQIQMNHINSHMSDIKNKMSDICTEVNYDFSQPAFLKDKQKSFERAKSLNILAKQSSESVSDLQGVYNTTDIVDISEYPRIDYRMESLIASVNRNDNKISGSVYCVNDRTYTWNGNALELNILVVSDTVSISDVVHIQAQDEYSAYFDYNIDISEIYDSIKDSQEIKIIFSVSLFPYGDVNFVIADSEKMYSFYVGETLNKNQKDFLFEINNDEATVTGYIGNLESIEMPHIAKGDE